MSQWLIKKVRVCLDALQGSAEQNALMAINTKKSVCVCVSLWLSLSVIPAQAVENLSVDFDTVIQENFLGINAVYHAFTYMPESIEQGMTPELRQIELGRIEESGLRIARTFYRPDWAMGEGVWTEPDWQSIKMKALYAWLEDMQEREVDVALNMGWWFARDVIWNRDQHLPTYPDDMQNYIAWVSESLHQIIEVRKFTNVKYIFMFTEPGNKYGDIPHGKKTWEYYKEVLFATHNRLVADNRRHLVKIIGPNTTLAPRWVEKAARELNDVVDIYTSHNYNFDTYQKWYDLAVKVREASKATGKPFWIDEYGIQDFSRRKSNDYGNIIAQANAAFINAGAQASMIWILNDQYYPYPLKHITNGDAFLDGKHSWGLYPWLPESRTVRPAWYAFSLLSRFMGGEGTKVYATKGADDLHISAVKLPDGNVSMLLVNGGDTKQEYSLHLSRPLGKLFYCYLYGANKTPLSISGHANTTDLIVGHIPAKGVLVYSTINDNSLVSNTAPTITPPYDENTEGNLALLKKVTLSSLRKGRAVPNLTDGKRLTYWKPGVNIEGPQEVVVDLEKVYKLHQIDLYLGGEGSLDKRHAIIEDITVALSDDKMSWHDISLELKDRREYASLLAFIFSERSARYVRIRIGQSQWDKAEAHGFQVGEIKVYGTI